MFTIVNEDLCRLIAVDHFSHPCRPVFSDVPEYVDEAMVFPTADMADQFLAGLSRNRAFDCCQVHNERPSSLYW